MKLFEKPNEFREGDVIPGSRTLNKMKDALHRGIEGGTNATVSQFGDRITIDSKHVQAPYVTELRMFLVIEEQHDLLLCRPLVHGQVKGFEHGGSPIADVGDPMFVAKPRWLQRWPFDGKTVQFYDGSERSFTFEEDVIGRRTVLLITTFGILSGLTVVENISPGYFQYDIIIAKKGNTGYVNPDPKPLYHGTYSTSSSSPSLSGSIVYLDTIDDCKNFHVGVYVRVKWVDPADDTVELARWGVEVTGQDLANGIIQIGGGEGDPLPADGTPVDVAVEEEVVWEDINEAARIWQGPGIGKVIAVLTEDLFAGSQAFASVWRFDQTTQTEVNTNARIRVRDWLLNPAESILSGTRITAFFDATSGVWYLDEARCPIPF